MQTLCEPLTEFEKTLALDTLEVCRDAAAFARRARSAGCMGDEEAFEAEDRAIRTANTVRECLGIDYREERVTT